MLSATLIAVVLAAFTAGIHVAGFAIMLISISPLGVAPAVRGVPIASQIMRVASFLIFVHGAEVGVWAFFYRFVTSGASAFH